MNAPETPLRARVVAELEKVESSTARRLTNILGLEAQPGLVLMELHAMEKEGLIERGTKRGREAWFFLANKLSHAAQAVPQPALGKKAGSSASVLTTAEGRAVAEETPEPEAAFPSFTAEGSGGNVWLSPEMQYLAPEDYELPPADPALLASANRMLQARLDGVAHVLRGCGLPGLAEVTGNEDLQPHASALAGAYQQTLDKFLVLRADYNSAGDLLGEITGDFDSPRDLWQLAKEAQDKINGLILELATERQAREALQEQINAQADHPAVDVKDAARGYLVCAAKRRPRFTTKSETAVAAAMSAARNGRVRVDVFALVPVGSARRGAEWKAV